MKARKAPKVLAVISVIVGILLGFLGLGTIYSYQYQYQWSAFERCVEFPEPEGVDAAFEINIEASNFTYFPIGLHCRWKLENGELVTKNYPELLPNIFVFGGLALIVAGAVTLGARSRSSRR